MLATIGASASNTLGEAHGNSCRAVMRQPGHPDVLTVGQSTQRQGVVGIDEFESRLREARERGSYVGGPGCSDERRQWFIVDQWPNLPDPRIARAVVLPRERVVAGVAAVRRDEHGDGTV